MDGGSSGPCLNAGNDPCVVFWGKPETFLFHCLSSTRSKNGYQILVRETYRNFAGDYLRWTSIPSRGSNNTTTYSRLLPG